MDEFFWIWYSPAGQVCERAVELGQAAVERRQPDSGKHVVDCAHRTVHVGEAVDDLVPAGHCEHAVLAASELFPASHGVQNTDFTAGCE